MKKRRIKKSVIKKGIILLLILTAIIILIITNNIKKYHNTNEYKLKQIGYTKEEINTIINLKEEDITYLLNNEYIEYAKEIINQKYYIPKNFQKYIEYKKTSDKEISKIISIINTERDKEEYTETKESDINLKQEMLVNKYNYLNKEYKPKDNLNYMVEEISAKKECVEDTKEEQTVYKENDMVYLNKIAPYVDNYTDSSDGGKGNLALLIIVTVVLVITVLMIAAAIYAISRMDM